MLNDAALVHSMSFHSFQAWCKDTFHNLFHGSFWYRQMPVLVMLSSSQLREVKKGWNSILWEFPCYWKLKHPTKPCWFCLLIALPRNTSLFSPESDVWMIYDMFCGLLGIFRLQFLIAWTFWAWSCSEADLQLKCSHTEETDAHREVDFSGWFGFFLAVGIPICNRPLITLKYNCHGILLNWCTRECFLRSCNFPVSESVL